MSHMSIRRLEPATSAATVSAALEQGVAQARTAVDCMAVAARLTLWSWQRATNTVQADATKIVCKSMTFADQNITAAFKLAEKLIHTKHPVEIIQFQQQYLVRQMLALSSQTQELSHMGLDALGSIGGLFPKNQYDLYISDQEREYPTARHSCRANMSASARQSTKLTNQTLSRSQIIGTAL